MPEREQAQKGKIMKGKPGSNVPMQPTIPKMPSNTSNALDALADAYKGRSNALKNQTKWNRMMLYLADLQLTYSPDWGANGQGDQKLYDFVTELIDEFSGWDVSDTNVGNKMQLSGESATKGTTFARGHENGLKRTEERTETHGVCLDAISRQAAIELCDWYDNPSMREDLEKLRPVRFSTDTISRKAAIKEVSRNITCKGWKDVARTVELMKIFADRIEQLPPAQPESDSGRWERHYSRPGVYADLYWHCSKCGYKTDYQYANVNHRYCPNCGRKMEREVSDE